MATSTLPITTVVTVSVETPNAGLQTPQQVNNLCVLTTEVPIASVPASGYFIYQNPTQVGADWGTNSETYAQAVSVFAQRPNILSGGGQLVIYYMTGGVTTLSQAINKVESLIYASAYLWAGYTPSQAEVLAAVVLVEALNKMIGVSSYLTTDLSGSGLFATLGPLNEPAGIMFLYTQTGTAVGARNAMAAFMGRGMSTNFLGAGTTGTMNLQTLAGISPDSGITAAIQNTCATLGVSIYPNIQNQPFVLSYGGPNANFFDTTYNTDWFVNALQVAVFNALAQTSTKIPQTETGMAVLRAAAIAVCQQAVANGFLAPGTWNGATPFGDPQTFYNNIVQNGYYVWTAPVFSQPQSNRSARQATVMQVAGKEAGAIQSAQVLIFFQP